MDRAVGEAWGGVSEVCGLAWGWGGQRRMAYPAQV